VVELKFDSLSVGKSSTVLTAALRSSITLLRARLVLSRCTGLWLEGWRGARLVVVLGFFGSDALLGGGGIVGWLSKNSFASLKSLLNSVFLSAVAPVSSLKYCLRMASDVELLFSSPRIRSAFSRVIGSLSKFCCFALTGRNARLVSTRIWGFCTVLRGSGTLRCGGAGTLRGCGSVDGASDLYVYGVLDGILGIAEFGGTCGLG